MKHTHNDARPGAGRAAEINRRRLRSRRYDRQRPETASAIREFEVWDRQMTERYGRLYYKSLKCSVH